MFLRSLKRLAVYTVYAAIAVVLGLVLLRCSAPAAAAEYVAIEPLKGSKEAYDGAYVPLVRLVGALSLSPETKEAMRQARGYWACVMGQNWLVGIDGGFVLGADYSVSVKTKSVISCTDGTGRLSRFMGTVRKPTVSRSGLIVISEETFVWPVSVQVTVWRHMFGRLLGLKTDTMVSAKRWVEFSGKMHPLDETDEGIASLWRAYGMKPSYDHKLCFGPALSKLSFALSPYR